MLDLLAVDIAVWDMYERVLIAALDAHDDLAINVSTAAPNSPPLNHALRRPSARSDSSTELSLVVPPRHCRVLRYQWCLETLLHRFGNGGLRMSRLLGLHCEYKQRWDEAAEHYNHILAADPTNIAAHKRLIALAKSRGQSEAAIALLSKYTKLFASDEAGWLELSLLYAQQQAWELAAFCYEELLLLVPEQPLYHTRYAELLYAQGKYDTARQYFAQAVELKPSNNLRALYGLLMVSADHTAANEHANEQTFVRT